MLVNIIFIALLASVEGAVIANPAPKAQSGHGISKLKRAAEAAAEAVADPPSWHGSCYHSGEVCSKAKRDALALAEATAEAFAAADPDARPCYAPGAPCSKAKREALDASENAPTPPTTTGNVGTHATDCWQAGGPCSKLKRAAEAVAEAIAQPNPGFFRETKFGSWHGECWESGEICSKKKRALDDVSSLLDKILLG